MKKDPASYRLTKNNAILLLACSYCVFLLLVRAKITGNIFLFFLIWNLFLAAVPYALVFGLRALDAAKRNNWLLASGLLLWLLFLPNSFYILTDFVHLSKSVCGTLWLDLVILASFSIAGFGFGLLSVSIAKPLLEQLFGQKTTQILIPAICLLCGSGIYLGRILRYNSWDVLHSPLALAGDLLLLSCSREGILFSLLFGGFIYLSCIFSQWLRPKPE